MGQSNDDLSYPAEPGTETKIRFARSRETTHGSEDDRVDPPLWKVGDIVEGFALEKLLGSGVTSTVYRVRELETDRRYALKILRTRCEQTRTASRLGFRRMIPFSHPSLVYVDRILSIGEYIGFTMEEVVGKRLVEVINETRGQGRAAVFELAYRLLHDIGGALQTIHDAGLVHRDVKPENVMVDISGRAKLIDYGLVGSYDPESDPDARRNYLAGTYWYMAPESISMQMYPPACDVYALGSVVLELIADHSQLPQEQAGVSLGLAIGDVRTFLPLDTPPDLADLLCDMLDPTVQNRPVAARLLQVRPGSTSPPEVATNFRRGRLFGREKEMAFAEQWVHSVVAGRPTRLHIRGDSGIGKTWFLAELLRRIRANPWFQVFDSACSDRADVPFQAFDAMADGIARRYSRDDREPIRLSPRHAILLRQAFPSLRPVLPAPDLTHEELTELLDATKAEQDVPGIASPGGGAIDLRSGFARSDSLASGVELVNAMCEYGPLFLIIDDTQWADQDSINALDQLLSDADGNLGIISVGRPSADRFRVPADCYIDLEPLTDSDSMALLRSLLCVKEAQWSELALTRLAMLGEGNAYRLTQLAACVAHDNPMEWHDRLLAGPIEIEDIWQNRLLHLSDEAKLVIETLAVAGGRTRMRDLTGTSGLLSRCDKAIKELIHLRLVYDEAPKVDAVQIIHHRVACRILSSMDPLRFRELHKSWANYLISCEHEPWRAARVAGHLIEANEPEAAVPYMIQAARDAEARFAFTESARWYQRAARNFKGPETVTFLSQALTRFEDAGCPSEAAEVCRDLLAYLPTGQSSVDRVPFLQRLANNLFCCGQTQAAMEVADQIAARLRTGNCNDQERDLLREACLSLHRPVMTFDARKASELLRIAMGRTKVEVMTASAPVFRGAVDAALTQCRNPGRRRKRSTAKLQAFIDDARQSDRPSALAVATSGMAYRHLLACDWASTVSSGNMALDLFRASVPACRFDLALTHLPVLWAFLWLGRLNELKSLSDRLTRESFEGNDEYLHQIVHAGPGCAASLMDDEVQLVRSVSSRFVRRSRELESPWLDLFQGFTPILTRLYEAQSLRALRYHRTLMGGARSKILKQVQLPRVLGLQLEGLAHLRSACALPVERSGSIAHVFHVCDLLDHERIAYAKALSKLFAAQSYEIIGDKDRCLSLYDESADIADSLDLVPFRLVAVDRIRMVRGESHSSELKRFLSLEGVTAPEKFARLYCGLCP